MLRLRGLCRRSPSSCDPPNCGLRATPRRRTAEGRLTANAARRRRWRRAPLIGALVAGGVVELGRLGRARDGGRGSRRSSTTASIGGAVELGRYRRHRARLRVALVVVRRVHAVLEREERQEQDEREGGGAPGPARREGHRGGDSGQRPRRSAVAGAAERTGGGASATRGGGRRRDPRSGPLFRGGVVGPRRFRRTADARRARRPATSRRELPPHAESLATCSGAVKECPDGPALRLTRREVLWDHRSPS